MDIREGLEKELERVLTELAKAKPGTENYEGYMKEAERLSKMLNEADQIELERIAGQYQRGLDDEKHELAKKESERNYEVAKMQAENDRIKAENESETQDRDSKRGMVKTVIGVVAMVAMGVFTIYSEETRIITSKAWTLMTKVLPKI